MSLLVLAILMLLAEGCHWVFPFPEQEEAAGTMDLSGRDQSNRWDQGTIGDDLRPRDLPANRIDREATDLPWPDAASPLDILYPEGLSSPDINATPDLSGSIDAAAKEGGMHPCSTNSGNWICPAASEGVLDCRLECIMSPSYEILCDDRHCQCLKGAQTLDCAEFNNQGCDICWAALNANCCI